MSLGNNTTFSVIPNQTALDQQYLPCLLAPDSTEEKISKLVGYGSILLCSFLGNTFIIIIVYKHRDLRKTVNYFIVNMAVSDLLSSLIVMPLQITASMTSSGHWEVRGILGLINCKTLYFVGPMSLQVSSQSLVWIAIDRFVAIVFPMKIGFMSNKIRTIAIVSTWIIAGLFSFPNLVISRLNHYGNITTCATIETVLVDHKDIAVHLWLQTKLFVVVPLFLVTCLYTAIAISLKRQSKALADTESNVQRQKKKRKQAIQMAVVIVVLFYVCVIPFGLLNIIHLPSCSFKRLFSVVAIFLAYSSSIVNPIICLSFVESYRRGLKNILCEPCRTRWKNKMAKQLAKREQITLKGFEGMAKNLPGENCPRAFKDNQENLNEGTL